MRTRISIEMTNIEFEVQLRGGLLHIIFEVEKHIETRGKRLTLDGSIFSNAALTLAWSPSSILNPQSVVLKCSFWGNKTLLLSILLKSTI